MGGITLAWLIGESIIVWRQVAKRHHPPVPGTLLASSGMFALLALVAEYPPARSVATLTAFGLDLAAWLEAPLITPKNTGGILPTPTGKPNPPGTAGNPIGKLA